MQPISDPLIPQKDVSGMVEPPISEDTLHRWREAGYGPPYVRIGRRIFYRKSALEAWLASRTFASTAAEAVNKAA